MLIQIVLGKYLQKRFPKLVEEVNSRLDGTKYVKVDELSIRKNAGIKYEKVGILKYGDKVTVLKTKGTWSKIGEDKWVNSKYLTSFNPSTVGEIKTLKKECHLYSKPSLTGIEYTYLKDTRIKILKNISKKVDYIEVIKTGRKAYINTKYYK